MYLALRIFFFLVVTSEAAETYRTTPLETVENGNEEDFSNTEYSSNSTTDKPDIEELILLLRSDDKELNLSENHGLKEKILKSVRTFFKKEKVAVKTGSEKAYLCSTLECPEEENITPVCACNFVTGNVASFKNKCDSLKHNCRFDTDFKTILNDICPWEFASRRSNTEFEFDYCDPKYYN